MVSPERGLQLMASKALDKVEGPVQECVSQVYTLLIAAARDAATVAGEHTEAAMNGKVPLNVPEFKTFIMPAIVRALDEWRAEAERSKQQLGHDSSGRRAVSCVLSLGVAEAEHGGVQHWPQQQKQQPKQQQQQPTQQQQ
jgi:hypothetical protein